MTTSIPQNMQAILLEGNDVPLRVGQIRTPRPGPGQVLIRMAAAPINPSDFGFLRGSYGPHRSFPVVPGLEGSGTVVTVGSGLLPRLWMGRRVVCSAAPTSGGTWAEYLVTSAASCFPLARSLSLEQGATLIVNPMTALAFLDIARRDRHAAIVNNAAAGSLGRMILRLGLTYRVTVIHIVRRQEQVDLLHSLGAEYVLNSSEPGFLEQLRTLSHQMKATLILDPVAGEQTQQLLDAAPPGSTALVYGTLSGHRTEPSRGSTNDGKRVTGFFLPDWLAKRNILQVLNAMRRVQQLAANELQTTIQKRYPLSAVQEAMDLSQAHPTAGKVLLVADPAQVPVDG